MSAGPFSPAMVQASRLEDAPDFSGPVLRPDGALGLYREGVGLVCGPLPPAQLRGLALAAYLLADELEAGTRDAAAAAAARLHLVAGVVGHA